MENKDTIIETEICHNCKKEVPQQNYLIHVSHCARNISSCPVCHESVPKCKLQAHQEARHAAAPCPACGVSVRRDAQHACPRALLACAFCELELPRAELDEHVYHCGARTDRCEECGELVMLKYQKLHRESNHGFIKLDDEPGPAPSWETTPHQNGSPLNNLQSLRSALPTNTPVKPKEKTACQREIEREESQLNNPVPPRDLPRTFVPAYDASEDLRAKVKLARHDLNNIKHSVLAGEERVRELSRNTRIDKADLLATNKKPPPIFQTNLVPYEKNKSHAINARNLQMSPTTPSKSGSACFTYLGVPQQNGGTSIATPVANNKGAVPRKKKQAPKPPVKEVKFNNPEDGIPCEFCGQIVSAEQLVLHETGCRPDLARLKPSSALAAPPSPEVQLPCEFCLSLFPASILLSHQAICDV